MNGKIIIINLLAAAAMLTAGCSKEPLPAGQGSATIRISAFAEREIAESVTRTQTIGLEDMGVPAELLAAERIMGSMPLRIACLDDRNAAVLEYASADEYNAENPRLSPVQARYDIAICSVAGRHDDPESVPEVEEGEGPEYVYLEGRTEVLLTGGKAPQNVDLAVRAANTAVCVEFSDEFRSYFAGGASVTLTTAGGFTAEVGYAPGTEDAVSATRYFWIRPQHFSLSARAVRQGNGTGAAGTVEFEEYIRPDDDVEPQTLYRCRFGVSNVGGTDTSEDGYGITVTLNGEPIAVVDLGGEELNPNAPLTE